MNHKLLSIVCAVCMIAMMFTFPVTGLAEDTRFIYENFDDGNVPTSFVKIGSFADGGYMKVVTENGRTFLDIKDTNKDTGEGFYVNIPSEYQSTTGKMTITFDLYMKNGATAGFMVNARNSANQNELSSTVEKDKINQNISVPSFSSDTIITNAGFCLEWKKLTYVMDFSSRKIDVYMGSELLKTVDFRWKSQYLNNAITSIQILGRGTLSNDSDVPKTISIDNFAVYNYEVIPEEEGAPPQDDNENEYLLNEDFEDETAGAAPSVGLITLNQQSGKKSDKTAVTVETKETLIAKTIEIPENFSNNTKFVKFSDYTKDNSNSNYKFDFTPQTGKVVIEYDLYKPLPSGFTNQQASNSAILVNADGAGSPGRGMAIHQWASKMQNYYNPDGGSTVTNVFVSADSGVLKPNVWQHYEFIIDYKNKVFSANIDGNVYQNLSIRDNLETSLKNISMLKFSGATIMGTDEWERTAYIDNIKVYDAEKPPKAETEPEPEPEPDPDPGETPDPLPEGVLQDIKFDNMTLGEKSTVGSTYYNPGTGVANPKTEIVVAEKPGEGFEPTDYCLKFSDFTLNSGNSNITFDFPAQKGLVVVEFDVYKPVEGENGKSSLLININDSSGVVGVATNYDGKSLKSYRGGLGSDIPFSETEVADASLLERGKWQHIKFIADYSVKVFRVLIDGVAAGGVTPFRLDSGANLGKFAISGSTLPGVAEYERTAYFDNLKIYVPEAPTVEFIGVIDSKNVKHTNLAKIPVDVKSIEVKLTAGKEVSINEATINAKNIILKDISNNATVECTLDFNKDENILSIIPKIPFKNETNYELSLKDIADTNGITAPEKNYNLAVVPPALKTIVTYWKNGQSVSEISAGDEITANVILTNTTDNLITLNVIFTTYCDGRASVKQLPVTVKGGKTATVDITNKVGNGNKVSASVYFWKSMDSMIRFAPGSFILQ